MLIVWGRKIQGDGRTAGFQFTKKLLCSLEPKEAESAELLIGALHTHEKKRYKTNMRPGPRRHRLAAVQEWDRNG